MPPEHATRLRAAGLRATPGRIALLQAIEGAGAPVTHAELSAHPALHGVDPITLYRALDAFTRAGLVHRVQGLDGVWRACAQPRAQAGCPGNHPHFYCARCGQLTCLTDQPLPRVNVPEAVSYTHLTLPTSDLV